MKILVAWCAAIALSQDGGAQQLVHANPYVVTRSIAVYEQPDPTSKIIDDLSPAPVKTFWGILVQNGEWVKILEIPEKGIDLRRGRVLKCSRRTYLSDDSGKPLPQTYTEREETIDQSTVKISAGRLSIVPDKIVCDGNRGYVRAASLSTAAEFSKKQPASPILNAVGQPVPSLWKRIGVDESRYWIDKVDAHPYDAVVLVVAEPLHSGIAGCSGFFVGKDVVVTSRHCVVDKTTNLRASEVRVGLLRSPGRHDVIEAVIVAIGPARWNDWAILKLKRLPNVTVEPLQFVTAIESETPFISGIAVGFPADLAELAVAKFGYPKPVASPCVFPMSRLELTRSRSPEAELFIKLAGECVITGGNSGGPFLLWSKERRKYEVLGIATSGDRTKERTGEMQEDLGKAINLLLRTAGREVLLNLNTELPDAKWSASDDAVFQDSFPGIAAVQTALIKAEIDAAAYNRQGFGSWTLHDEMLSKLKVLPEQPSLRTVTEIASGNKFISGTEEKKQGYQYLRQSQRCARQCKEPALLDHAFQFQGTVGDTISAAAIEAYRASPSAMVWKFGEVWVVFTGGDFVVVHGVSGEVKDIARGMWRSDSPSYLNRIRVDRISFSYREEGDLDRGPHPAPTKNINQVETPSRTPISIPGGEMLRSWGLFKRLFGRKPPGMAVFSVTTAPFGLPGTMMMPFAGDAGTFDDEISRRLGEILERVTHGRVDNPLVFYGENENDWRGYNAALRAMSLGYTNVSWYRWGLDGWLEQKLPVGMVSSPP